MSADTNHVSPYTPPPVYPVALEDYALLGDRRTAALVSRAGSVDWWCVPRFDAGACFAALLGSEAQGRFLVAPVAAATTTRVYRPGTMVLETVHQVDNNVVRVTDCLATGTDTPTLVRIVEGIEGTVEMHAELIVRFDYGSIVPWVHRVDDSWAALAGPDGVEMRTSVRMRGHELTTVGSFTINAGEHHYFTLAWFPSHEPGRPREDAWKLVAETTTWWERWSKMCAFDASGRDSVIRSLMTLEALTLASTGGIVAAPTTSVPERFGGSRNWDYRFCWVRDATLTLESLLIGGYRDEALRWRRWLLRAAAGDPQDLQTMYGVGGERRLTELELDWLPGYGGAQPVRIGNAAHSQLQLDVFGELIDVMWQAMRAGAELTVDEWSFLDLLLEVLEQRWREPDEGIWEVRGPRQHFTHSKVMCWVAFDRAVSMAKRADVDAPVDRWAAARDEIHGDVCAKAWNDDLQAFTQSYGSQWLDASVLMIPLVGFLSPGDERVASTIRAIEEHLMPKGFVQRYDPRANVDGIGGESEGAFLPCSFWMVEALALSGRDDDARELFEKLLAIANDVGLYAEEFDEERGRMCGNFPQAFTHLALVGAAHTLYPGQGDTTPRRRDRHNHD